MKLKEILTKIIEKDEAVLLSDARQDWEAGELLSTLSDQMLNRQAHREQGLYIAEMNEAGYLGKVMFKEKYKA